MHGLRHLWRDLSGCSHSSLEVTVKLIEVIAKVRNLPFDKLRVNGLRLKSFTFSVRGELVEPQKNTFAIGSY